MDDTIGQNKCLGEKCPNHCCTDKFIGLVNSLVYENSIECGKPLLDDDEYRRIYEFSGEEFIEMIDGKPYLKVYDDNMCAAFKDGKCSIYEVRPDACKLYPFYFDHTCGFCKDKNCPGNFTKADIVDEHFELLRKKIDLYEKEFRNKKDGELK